MAMPLLLLLACTPAVLDGPSTPGEATDPTGTVEDTAPVDTTPADTAPPDTTPVEDTSEPDTVGAAGIVFNPEHGLVEDAFDLEISWGLSGGELHYTTDATDPRDPANPGVLTYDGPIHIEANTVIRAVVFHEGEVVGELETRTWIFPAQVLDQARVAPWPTAWFGSYGSGTWNAADYDMDPEVVDADPAAVEAALWDIPTVSLVVALDDLFSGDGIYDNPTSDGEEWERPASLELLPTDSEEGFAIEAGARIHGGASRYPENTPKKSFRIVFKKQYGEGELHYPLYKDYDIDHFDTLLLRGGYNHPWTHWSPEQRGRALFLRDAFAADGQLALGDQSVHNRAVQLYIDGVYWGLYRLAERPDARSMEAWYGGDSADWDVINTTEAVDGTDTAWLEALAMATAKDTAGLTAVVDTANLIDYMLLNFYLGNDDWPHNNWYATRMRPDGLWRFFEWDAEHTLKDLSTDMTGTNSASSPAQLWVALMTDPDFKAAAKARVAEIFADDGPLGVEAATARFEARIDEVDGAVIAESARWGDYRRDVYCYASAPCSLYTVGEYWEVEKARLLDDYLPQRTAVVQAQLAARGL